jgi:hypothetical protein
VGYYFRTLKSASLQPSLDFATNDLRLVQVFWPIDVDIAVGNPGSFENCFSHAELSAILTVFVLGYGSCAVSCWLEHLRFLSRPVFGIREAGLLLFLITAFLLAVFEHRHFLLL